MSTAPVGHSPVPEDTLPLRLYLARFMAGRISAKEAGLRVGVSDQTWRNWESGLYLGGIKRKSMMRYVAQQLHIDEDWLRDGGPLRAPDPDGGGVTSNGDIARYLRPIRSHNSPLVVHALSGLDLAVA